MDIKTIGQNYEITHPGTQQQSNVLTEKIIYPDILWQTYNNKLTGIIDDNDLTRNPVNWKINPNIARKWTKVFRLNDPKLVDKEYIGKWFTFSETDDLPAWCIYMLADNMLPIIQNSLGFDEDITVATIHCRIYLQGVTEDTVGSRLPDRLIANSFKGVTNPLNSARKRILEQKTPETVIEEEIERGEKKRSTSQPTKRLTMIFH